MARFSNIFILIPENSSISGADFCNFALTTRWKAQRIALFKETFSPEQKKNTAIKSNSWGAIGLPEHLCWDLDFIQNYDDLNRSWF